jgi:hypothetical protein
VSDATGTASQPETRAAVHWPTILTGLANRLVFFSNLQPFVDLTGFRLNVEGVRLLTTYWQVQHQIGFFGINYRQYIEVLSPEDDVTVLRRVYLRSAFIPETSVLAPAVVWRPLDVAYNAVSVAGADPIPIWRVVQFGLEMTATNPGPSQQALVWLKVQGVHGRRGFKRDV